MTTHATPRTALPGWQRVLAVIAHPDDESFGLGGVIGELARAGADVAVLCFTQGGASTLHTGEGELREIRSRELTAAADILGVRGVELRNLPDGELSSMVPALTRETATAITRYDPDGLLIFHRDGVTGHPDHAAAGTAALAAADDHALPVLEWTLPAEVATTLSKETGGSFTGYPRDELDIAVKVNRALHRRAIWAHESQAVPDSPLWRRLKLLGKYEYLQLRTP